MNFKDVKELAYALKLKIDEFISKDINREDLKIYIKEIISVKDHRNMIYRQDGYAVTINRVLGDKILPLFTEILNEINSKH